MHAKRGVHHVILILSLTHLYPGLIFIDKIDFSIMTLQRKIISTGRLSQYPTVTIDNTGKILKNKTDKKHFLRCPTYRGHWVYMG